MLSKEGEMKKTDKENKAKLKLEAQGEKQERERAYKVEQEKRKQREEKARLEKLANAAEGVSKAEIEKNQKFQKSTDMMAAQ